MSLILPSEIIAFVSKLAGVTVDEVRGNVRSKKLSRVRAVLSVIFRDRGMSYPHIGRRLNKDHSSIHYAVDTFEARYGNDPVAQQLLDYTQYEFLNEPKTKTSYGMSSMEVGDTKEYPFKSPVEQKRICRAAHNYNGRGDKYFITRTKDGVVYVKRIK